MTRAASGERGRPVRFFVDRVTGGVATLIYDGTPDCVIDVPMSSLPPGASEGDYLAVSFVIDAPRGADVRGQIDSLMDELGDNP
ncbi:MAG: DUF3006 domain-containing protein [Synergistaceae bacterium]|jgi:hypothetical protein|nr:DUF3006 domain-containing protein [Synergistaceae bacterium]